VVGDTGRRAVREAGAVLVTQNSTASKNCKGYSENALDESQILLNFTVFALHLCHVQFL
jgi:hypothetical protein